MNRKQILTTIVLPGAVIAGATSWHLVRKNIQLDRQLRQKAEGLVTVNVAKVEERAFRGAIPFTGTLLAVNRAELKAEVAGRVTRVLVQEGDAVHAGSVLSTQDEEDLQLAVQAAEAQLAQAQAQAEQAKRDYGRAQQLLEKRSVTKQAAQQAETFYNATSAGARAAESNLGLAKSRLHKAQIRSPFAGQVAQRLAQPGEMLAPGQPAFVVVDNRRLEILADLPTEAAAAVQKGMPAVFKLQGLLSDRTITGTVTQVSPSLTADGRTLRVRIEVPNPDGTLKSGFFAEGEIQARSEIRKPALPSGVMTVQGREGEVFTVGSLAALEGGLRTGYAARRKIAVGTEQEGWRAVDLPLGTLVVGQGRDQVVDGSKLRIVDVAPAKER